MLYRKKIDKLCSYCVNACKIDDENCLCSKKGFVSSDYKCRRFKYDPLKRVPKKAKPVDFEDYDTVDFSL